MSGGRGYGGAMPGDARTRPPLWAWPRPVRLLAGLAGLVLASTLSTWSPVAAAADPGVAAAAPVVAAGPSVPDDLAAAAPVVAATAPQPVGEPAAGAHTHAPRWSTTDEPTGGSPRAVGQRAPPAARA
jgi:hypothetical protein